MRNRELLGIQGLPIAEEYGGTGADILSTMLAVKDWAMAATTMAWYLR